jgi:hypothetical protein
MDLLKRIGEYKANIVHSVGTVDEGRKRVLLIKAEIERLCKAAFAVHPTHCKAGPRGLLTSLSPFPYSLVLQWNTTLGL